MALQEKEPMVAAARMAHYGMIATVGLGVSDFVYRIFALLVSVRFVHFA